MNTENKVNKILNKYNRKESFLISILQDIQEEYNYLPKNILEIVAKELNLPLIQIYGVATFFKAFSLNPKGKHILHICMGTACHVKGAPKILDTIETNLNIKAGETTDDKQFTLEIVNCLGACAIGPIVVADKEYHGYMNSSKVSSLLKNLRGEKVGK